MTRGPKRDVDGDWPATEHGPTGADGAPHALVVGGGLAGITSALILAERGWRVTLAEARPRLGGRATSYQRRELTVDNGQHVFLRCCTAYRALLERLDAGPSSGLSVLQDRLDIPLRAPDGKTARLRRTGAPAPLHLAGSLLGYGLLPARDRARLGRAALALRFTDPADPAVDAQGFGPFMRRHGQSGTAVNRLWSVISTATLNIDPDAASLALAAKVFRTGLLEDNAGSDLGYAAVPLGEIHDTRARAALTKQGVDVRDATKVLSLDAARNVTLRTRDEGELTLRPDAVVLAVPHDVAAGLLPPEVPRPFAELGHSPIMNVHVRYDRPVLDGPFLAGVDSPAQWIFDRTGPTGLPGAGRYVAVTVSAADALIDQPVADLRPLFESELARLLPKARDAAVEEFFVTREKHATFRQASGTAALRPGPATPVEGLYLAGAWTATGWPDTMESAVRSGISAARVAQEQWVTTHRTEQEQGFD
ncbi:MAG TPA: hydroxysqualene dehydroxylase HpnE [Actinospica sp.]|jgi:squalene-associated FAD-dependent desaturase|nr:hydroxysqualene dehydroxylase HpnE [Actinospica sp.]